MGRTMRVGEIDDVGKYLYRRVRIVKIAGEEGKFLEGKTGIIVRPWVNLKGRVGLMVDDSFGLTHPECNLLDNDVIEFIDE